MFGRRQGIIAVMLAPRRSGVPGPEAGGMRAALTDPRDAPQNGSPSAVRDQERSEPTRIGLDREAPSHADCPISRGRLCFYRYVSR